MTIKEQVRKTVKSLKQGEYKPDQIATVAGLTTDQTRRAMKEMGHSLKNGFYFIRNKGRFVGI